MTDIMTCFNKHIELYIDFEITYRDNKGDKESISIINPNNNLDV